MCLTSKFHLHEEETVRGSIYKSKEGCASFMGILVDFVRQCPVHVGKIARALYFPLVGEQVSFGRLGSCAASEYMEATAGLMEAAVGSSLMDVLQCLVDSGHTYALQGAPAVALVAALRRLGAREQMCACRLLSSLAQSLGASGSVRPLRSLLCVALPGVREAAQLELCSAVCALHHDLQYQLINEQLLRGAGPTAQLRLCRALCRLDHRRVQSTATESLLACLHEDARRTLCAALVVEIHALPDGLRDAVLRELLVDDAANEHQVAPCSDDREAAKVDDAGDVEQPAVADMSAKGNMRESLGGAEVALLYATAAIGVTACALSAKSIFGRR